MKEAPEHPRGGAAAFEGLDPESVQAQAAILLAVGAELRGDRPAAQALPGAVAEIRDELDEFPIPRLTPPGIRVSPRRAAEARFGITDVEEGDVRPLAQIADDLYQSPSTAAAAALAHAALKHPHELVRVAGAHAVLAVTTEPAEPYRILVEGTRSSDELVQAVAATALARYRPEDPALRELTVEPEPPREGTADTSTLIHGTWAANGTWWRPNGDFWDYIDQSVWVKDLYSGMDFYKWSGGYSNGARDQGADLLVAWINSHGVDGLSLMAHSHGTSVTMLASWRGVKFGRVVFLSSPVHPALYNMNFNAVQKVVSIRVKMDLVLLVDGSETRFADPRYNEHVLPVWFNHSATHDPAIWVKYNVPAML